MTKCTRRVRGFQSGLAGDYGVMFDQDDSMIERGGVEYGIDWSMT